LYLTVFCFAEERVTKIIAVSPTMYQRLMDRPDLLTVSESQIPKSSPQIKPETPVEKEQKEGNIKQIIIL
jgi:hypothetical protein